MARRAVVVTSVEPVEVGGPCVLLDHTHAVPHLLVMLDGEIVEDGRVYRAGDVRLSAAGDRHFLRFTRPSRCLVIEANGIGTIPGSRRIVHRPGLAASLRRTTSADGVANQVGAEDWLGGCEDEPPAWLSDVHAHCLGGNLDRSPGLEAAARAAGVSREHLARTWRRHFGTTFTAAVRARRLREAFDALARSPRPLAEVAAGSGFADQSHMTREFAAWIGLTPGALRQSLRAHHNGSRNPSGTPGLMTG